MPKINTYTDNATIEDVDALLTYDPAGNGATKLTTFARIASWISSKLSALTKKTSIASTDQLVMVDGAASPVVTKRIDYNVLAKAIIEQYASSSLAGANQSVKTAIDALNSKSYWLSNTGTSSSGDLNDFVETGTYYFNVQGTTAEHFPVVDSGKLIVELRIDSYKYKKQTFYPANGNGVVYTRNYNDGVFTEWATGSNKLTLMSDVSNISASSTNNSVAISFIASGVRYTVRFRIDAKMITLENNTTSTVIWNMQ